LQKAENMAAAATKLDVKIQENVCSKFKLSSLKPYQIEAFQAVIDGRDVFIAVFICQPTGSGKSFV